MSDRSLKERTGDQECESQLMIKIKPCASAWKNVWAHVHSVFAHTWVTEGGTRVHAAPFSLQPCNCTSVPEGAHRRGKQEASFQLPTGHFKQQSAKLKNVSNQKSHSDMFPLEPFSLLWRALAWLQTPATRHAETESRSRFLRTANSPVSKNSK